MTLRREIYLVTGVVVLIVLPIIASVIISTVDKYQSLRYIQVLDKALGTADDSLCFEINYNEFRDKCLLELGIRKNASNLCEKIRDNVNRNSCIYAVAVTTKNDSLCDHLVSIRNRPPDRITLTSTKFESAGVEECKNEVHRLILNDAINSKNYANCNNNEECEYQIAIMLNDSEHCDTLKSSKNSCWASIAINSKNVNLCGHINDQDLKDECIFSVAKVIIDHKLCRSILGEPKNKACLDYFYCNDKDHMCHPNDNLEYRQKIKLIAQQGSVKGCDDLPQLAREFCYFEFAIKGLSPSYCDVLRYAWRGHEGQDYNLQEECYNAVAIYSLNQTICTRATKYKNECVNQILIAKEDLNITTHIKIRNVFWGSAGIWGDFPSVIYLNEGNVYVNSSEYGCYLPGAIMPGTECLTHEFGS